MKRHGRKPVRISSWWGGLLLVALLNHATPCVHAQTADQQSLKQQVQQLTEAMTRTQAQLEESQRQLNVLREQLETLQRQLAQSGQTQPPPTAATGNIASPSQAQASSSQAAIDEIREHQAIQDSEIATHEQTKIESESRYPIKLTGLLLLNGFVNTNAVDMPSTPTLALPGAGTTGASIRQTILGFDARGPHLFGASSYADLRVDFDGTTQSGTSIGSYSGYSTNTTLLRLRTAHAGLRWDHTEAYFALDRPLFSPDSPSSLVAVAQPALAWSGNLWTWNPQVGINEDIGLSGSRSLRLQAALIDVGDAPIYSAASFSSTAPTAPPSSSEQSRWPGVEARIALLGSKQDDASHLGIGGYFSPHVTPSGVRFDAWAATLDTRFRLPAHFEFTGYFYRGLALGGLGGGAYKDYGYRISTTTPLYHFRPLSDVGGWLQLKERLGERVELNGAFGLDNDFANELRRYIVPAGTMFDNLARNKTFTGNVIYSPSAYLMFSLEYRHLLSSPITGSAAGSHVIGAAAGYRF